MRRILIMALAGVALVTLAVQVNNYINNRSYNKCMIAEQNRVEGTREPYKCSQILEEG